MNGDSLILTNQSTNNNLIDRFAAISNRGTRGFYNTQVSEDGNVSLEPTNLVGPPTQEQKAFSDLMHGVINDDNAVNIDLWEGADHSLTGNFDFNSIDIADVEKFGNGPIVSAQGALIHEVAEQQAKQSGGLDSKDTALMAHSIGVMAENSVNGSTRLSVTEPLPSSNYTMDVFGVINGRVDMNFQKNGIIGPVSIHVNENNIKKVKQ